MPVEIFDEVEFLELAKKADSCRVKRTQDEVKLKLRLPKKMYILKTSPQKADILTRKLDIDIVEL